MKAIILSVLLFFTVNLPDGKAGAQTNWYVSNQTYGNGSADSWGNADVIGHGESGAFDWSQVSGGDTIYIDGGTDSLIYEPIWIDDLPFTSEVVFTIGEDAGHNGEVWVKNTSSLASFQIGNGSAPLSPINNLTIYGLNLYTTVDKALISIYESNYIKFESCSLWVVTSGTTGAIIGIGVCSNTTLKDNYVETVINDEYTWCDGLYMSGGTGGHIIDGNTFILRGSNPNPNIHRDCLQIGYLEGGTTHNDRPSITIKNNFIWAGDTTNVHMNCAIYGFNSASLSWHIYNNIFVWVGNGARIIDIGRQRYVDGSTEDMRASVRFYNNTAYNRHTGSGSNGGTFWFEGQRSAIKDTAFVDSLWFKNNIVFDDSGSGELILGIDAEDYLTMYKEIDYNRYYTRYPTLSYHAYGVTTYSFSTFQGLGFETNSSYIPIEYVDYNGLNITDFYTTTGRDLAIDLSSVFTTDILGNTRSGSWDMGAIEYNGGQSNNVNVKCKIFLQGPFYTNTSSMLTTLNQGSLLPNSQPYNSPPWNYNGNENLGSGPSATMVDWVLVELRSSSNPSQVVARRAAVLKNDGLLLNINGVEGVAFNNVDPGSYYIAIYHRDHLAIMSAVPVQLTSNSDLYDFTTAMNKAYGPNPMVELVPGKFGMYAADGNADGVVDILDRDEIWLMQNGNMGYLEGDYNMNSGVTVHDINQLWNINNGAVTRVP